MPDKPPDSPLRALILAAFLIIVAFFTIYFNSFTINYVEGDDAQSIAYHVMGRNEELASPYQPYQLLMDRLLALLPPNQNLLLNVGMSITAVSSVTMAILIFALVSGWARQLNINLRPLAALALLLAIPEFFYLGMVYSPAMIGMTWMLAAHLLAQWGWDIPAGQRGCIFYLRMTAAIIFFAVGGAFRWDLISYATIIVVDLALRHTHPPYSAIGWKWRWAIGSAIWGFISLAVWFGLVVALGEWPFQALGVANYEMGVGSAKAFNALGLAGLTALFSPAILILGTAGLVIIIRTNQRFLLIVVACATVTAIWLQRGEPKLLLPAWPGIVFCFLIGFSVSWNMAGSTLKTRRRIQTLLLVLLVFPWIIGIRVTYGDTCWGPGFECRPFNRATMFFQIYPYLGSGSAIPTVEGPQALFGHAWALLFGGRKQFVQAYDQEYNHAVEAAIERKLPLLDHNGSGWIMMAFDRFGYRLVHSENVGGATWTFIHPRAEPVPVFWINGQTLQTAEQVLHIQQKAGSRLVILHGVPSTLRNVYLVSPSAMEMLDGRLAVLDLQQLAIDLAQRETNAIP